jgi:DNA-binding CsgD family transcriptional regulator
MQLYLKSISPMYLSAENNIRAICNKMLNPLGISYFNYLRFYNDGSAYLLTTHGNLIQYVFENDIPVAAPISEKLIKKNFHYFILPIDKYSDLIHYAKTYLNIGNFIDLVERHEDYIELFCYGSNADHPEIVNYYLNNMNFLENFKLYFKEEAACLLKEAENKKIQLSELMYPPYMGLKKQSMSHFENPMRQKFYFQNKNITLTSRQYDCLEQLAFGCTSKEAAKNLGLSYRTVENYLANLKSLFNCHRKSQLINIFLKNYKE